MKGQLKFMSQYYEVIGVSSEGKELFEVEKNEEIKVHAINMSRSITPLFDLISLFKLVIFFIKTKPLIVHTHTPKAGFLGMIAAKLAFVPKRFHTVAGMPLMETTGFKRRVLELVEKITYCSASMIYPNSVGLYNFILSRKLARIDKLKVIGNGSSNGINTEYFSKKSINPTTVNQTRKDLKLDEKEFIFLFVGRIVREKGIEELIKAFLMLNHPKAKLLLVGNFEEDLDPVDYKVKFEIFNNQNIVYVGYQEDVRLYYAIANVLVFPSYREGFPNVVMQAGSMELPSIVTDINGCNEIIANGENGVIVPVKNIGELKNAMLKIMIDKNLYAYLKSNSRNYITDRFECNSIWNRILLEYES